MNEKCRILKEYLEKTNDGKISSDFADYLNHSYGNVKIGKNARQYVFSEDDLVADVIEFLKFYYSDLWEGLEDS